MRDKEVSKILNINPHKLELGIGDSAFSIRYDGEILKTIGNNNIASQSPRLLQHIIRELTITRKIDTKTINSYSLFSLQYDYLEKNNDLILDNFRAILASDPYAEMKTLEKIGSQSRNVEYIMNFIDGDKQTLNFMFGGISSIMKSLNDFLDENESGLSKSRVKDTEKFFGFIKKIYLELPAHKKTAVTMLSAVHDSGLILPLLLVKWRITPSEYVNALFSIHLPLMNGSLNKDGISDMANILTQKLNRNIIPPDWNNPYESFNELKEQVFRAIEYISYFKTPKNRFGGIRELINMGESYSMEFKSTFRYNKKTSKFDINIEYANLKSMAGFLNSGGGTLMIGVQDDGSINGIEEDGFPTEDRFLLHIWNCIRESLGTDLSPYIRTKCETIDGKLICMVQCSASPRPVFLRKKGRDEEFYIRTGPSSASLNISDALKYISERFSRQ